MVEDPASCRNQARGVELDILRVELSCSLSEGLTRPVQVATD